MNEDHGRKTIRKLNSRDVCDAWAAKRFTLDYQPQFDLRTNQIVAFEALLRWPDAKHGHVAPGIFIPLLEEAGIIDDVSEWVLDTACREAVHWPDDIRIAVNISPIQLRNASLPVIVRRAVGGSGLLPSQLELELTESRAMPTDAGSLARLHAIRDTGVRIVMDDFDTGHSALGYLARFPFDKMKVDRFFTAKLGRSESGYDVALAIFRAIVGLCAELGITLLAEGVETSEQLQILRDLHCHEVQGYLCGRPQPAAAIPDMLSRAPQLPAETRRGGTREMQAVPAVWPGNPLFHQVAEALNDIVIVTTSELEFPGPHIVYVNSAFTRLTGFSAAEVIGRTPRILQGPGTSRAALDKILVELKAGRPVRQKLLNYGKSGAPYWLDLQIVGLRNAAGEITHFVAIERDVTLDKRRLDELECLADRDNLTGIPNRRALVRAVNCEIETAIQDHNDDADSRWPCLVFIDVDHFKLINDKFGHATGDAVLCGIADCLAENVRRIDILGRIGGEEFAVCMPAIDLRAAKALAGRLRGAIAAAPVATPTGPVTVTVSVGVARFMPGDDAETLMARADAAMYAAKRAGRNRVRAIAPG